ncbi:probable plastidic glucose transporter 2 isoform X1 [Ziziphus jujuba]|uniref:Probable plastidic glucose transporter 2 n=1 Tax=Ziziphus jujuba TaxID=326968 RepID=A0A6P4AKD9_ZIZJJ|nr:probable plastidic glucose transporter 2 isoform X1 [Ziziphus jujuba]XP_015898272.1 probable plastidic glucose transporter 2 isoform X1 [Ziziphus jujuba]XP_015898273.1 probable plastidic glucose transporter 2 isoform X1 [Ziziphus jujuba]XP_015898274.1 probable plastidic glucose transporter 2 isoform X1 [Ziziphus jujuba]XP_015898276.1 probable plastidic glucose transporter 2 isoform X1 [Ziziphus jujuba]XP_024922662.1 probable plastidic glucose transporter 2 isoform X1 [Ziziphus jujuba]XP_02
MWTRQRETSSMYKRLSSRDNTHTVDVDSRDYLNTTDMEENSALLQNNVAVETSNPPWGLSFPHVVVATISPFLYGYHLGVVNEPLESISRDLGFSGNALAEGLVVSTCLGGAFIGSLFSGMIADGVGRRRAFQLCALPMVIGAAVSATAKTIAGMLLGRLLVGAGMGLGPPVVSLYVTEVSPAFVRGTYGSFIQLGTCLGLMAALFVGIPVKEIAGWWRVCFWLSTIPAATLALGMVFCAESPHWLYKQGKTAEAEAEFERLLGVSHVKIAMGELSKTDRGDDMDTVKISELLYGRHFRVIFIGSTLFALQQLSGINAVFYFSSTVFKSAGVPSNLANGFIGIANLIGSIFAMVLMDRLGRKVLLLWSFFGMAISMAIQVAAASSYASGTYSLYLSVGGMLMFVLTFALGAGPVPSLLLPEIFPSRIRAKAMAICLSVHWVINFFVGLLFLRLLEQLGPQLLYSMFATFCLMAVAFVKRNVVETKGKSLQEIEIALLPQE